MLSVCCQAATIERRSMPPSGYITHTVSAPSLHGKTVRLNNNRKYTHTQYSVQYNILQCYNNTQVIIQHKCIHSLAVTDNNIYWLNLDQFFVGEASQLYLRRCDMFSLLPCSCLLF